MSADSERDGITLTAMLWRHKKFIKCFIRSSLVFYCESEQDAQTLIHLAIKHHVCLVPFGGGASVSAALKLPNTESRIIVAVNMQRMNRIEWIDRDNLRACVQAGITGTELEKQLIAAGFTFA